MKHSGPILSIIATTTLLLIAAGLEAAEIRVAVASNFAETFAVIATQFERHTGHKVIQITGSTGKHYAQIRNGAPFDAYFAADAERPEQLEQQGIALPGSRFTYALGKLILWSPLMDYVDEEGRILADGNIRHLAIANPRLAPYGRAAQEVLQSRGEWQSFQGRLVRGENIGQTFQFVSSGNAALGFIARSQVMRPGQSIKGSLWDVPQSLYSPIEQQAVMLRESDIARDFLAFMRSEESLQTIRGFGYGAPDAE
ncbi:MAG: molybdate ABC transporter substrate-binding protein [Gammaproteobacteria bacterium]|nr:molybdate ABC transporter substrate-binding protein [Gammaproteobacteria bacterium]MCP5407813.1 molybdate ABC transporter substrate-binding protein [Chromatiaceae bacterium]MCP5441568.1 molybdate ABC transporter substrate-binding protein [Chromatiaceae bacterium]